MEKVLPEEQCPYISIKKMYVDVFCLTRKMWEMMKKMTRMWESVGFKIFILDFLPRKIWEISKVTIFQLSFQYEGHQKMCHLTSGD